LNKSQLSKSKQKGFQMTKTEEKIRAYPSSTDSMIANEKTNLMVPETAESALMENHLSGNREMSMGVWYMINTIAEDVYRSRLFPVSSPQQAAVTMLKGYEIGLGLMASFEFVQVVKGHVGLSPKGALALLHNSPKIAKIELTRLTDENHKFIGYECMMKRADNGFQHTERWVLDDAVTAQLMKPDSNWEKYPENMCKWRAIGFCADVVAPDVTAGMVDFMIRPEQFNIRVDDEGNIIEGQFNDNPQKVKRVEKTVVEEKSEQSTNQPNVSLAELLDQYSAETILQANNGTIPGTSEELERVANTLIKEAQEGGN
jgi:hypothetical protein